LDASGWNQWQNVSAPLSTAQSSTAAAMISAFCESVIQAADSSQLPLPPFLARYFSAVTPTKQ
jgi:hypothetical protein